MAPVALGLAPALRPWAGAGVSHLLVEADIAAALNQAASSLPSTTAKRPLRAVISASSATASATAMPSTSASRTSSPVPQKIEKPSKAAIVAPTSTKKAEPVALPPAWQSLWAQMSASCPSPMAVWTYAELGKDLRGEASGDRRRLLKDLIDSLKMPKGSHVFWPYSLPPDNIVAVDMFLAGIALFRPASVLIFGDQAIADLSVIGDLPSGPLQNCLCLGYRIMRLPDMDNIERASASARSRLITFVRASLV